MSKQEEERGKPQYSAGGVDYDHGIIFEQVRRLGGAVYARSDDPGILEPTITPGRDDRTLSREERATFRVLDDPPWKLPPESISYLDEAYLFHSTRSFLEMYVELKDPRYYDVLAASILASWRMDEWRAIGPVCLLGPINSGKTTLLEILEELFYRAIRGGSMSTATIFRLADSFSPSLLVDESQIYNREEWAETKALLNERYRRGGRVWRMVGEGRDQVPRGFRCFGSTVFASSNALWDALNSRALLIKMEKNTGPVQSTLTPQFYIAADKLRGQLLQYRFRNLKMTIDREIDPEAPPDPVSQKLEVLKDYRTREIGYPLLAVAPEDTHEAILSYLLDLEGEHQAVEETGEAAAYVVALSQCVVENGKVSVQLVRLELKKLWEITDDRKLPHPRHVSKVLRTLGFKPTRTIGGQTAILWEPKLMERLRARYRVGVQPSSIASLSSDHEWNPPSQSEAIEGREDSQRGVLQPPFVMMEKCSSCGKTLPLRQAPNGQHLVCKSCYEERF